MNKEEILNKIRRNEDALDYWENTPQGWELIIDTEKIAFHKARLERWKQRLEEKLEKSQWIPMR